MRNYVGKHMLKTTETGVYYGENSSLNGKRSCERMVLVWRSWVLTSRGRRRTIP